jgi:hypothetical protein
MSQRFKLMATRLLNDSNARTLLIFSIVVLAILIAGAPNTRP